MRTSRSRRVHQLIAIAAHELLTPLTHARAELALALDRDRNPGDDERLLHELLCEMDAMISLSRDLLTLSAVGTPERSRRPEVCIWGDVVRRALQQVPESLWAGDRLAVVGELQVSVRGRFDDLVRMLRNLLDNAFKHGPSEGRIRVMTQVRGGELELRLQDDGRILAEDHQAIFDPLYQGAGASEEGAGLGLAIAREIARGHDGDLYLDVSAPSTCFVARLHTIET